MKEYLIGAGGWSYFQIPGLHSLIAYSRAFNFVEANTTFYHIPSTTQAEKWRKLVPSDFQFAVRAHRTITHKHKLQPTPETLESFKKMKQICSILKAEVLHLLTPPALKLSDAIPNMRNLLDAIDPGKLRLAIEIRSPSKPGLPPELVKLMQDHNIIHCVDLSKDEKPAYKSDMLYTRLFGKGKHNIYQPTDDELAQVDDKVKNANYEKAKMSFHFVRMYKDAARLKIYRQTGKFPPITNTTGVSSLEQVLGEDAAFPTTKQELIQNQGWKLFDLTEDRRIRAAEILRRLPERAYSDMKDVEITLESIMG